MDKVQFYKNLILGKIEELREDLGELRYQIYRDSVLRCEDYSQLRDMADLELQMDMAKYIRDLKERLARQGIKIEDLREEIELNELLEDEESEEFSLEPEIKGDASRVYQEEIGKLVGVSSVDLEGIDIEIEDDEDWENEEEESGDDLGFLNNIGSNESDEEDEEDDEPLFELEDSEDGEEEDGEIEIEIEDEENWESEESEDDLSFLSVTKVEDSEDEEENDDIVIELEDDEEGDTDLSWLNGSTDIVDSDEDVIEIEMDDDEEEEADLSWMKKEAPKNKGFSDFDDDGIDIIDLEDDDDYSSDNDLEFLNNRRDPIDELGTQKGFIPFNEGFKIEKPSVVKPESPKREEVKKAPFNNGTDRGKKTQSMFDNLNKVVGSITGMAEKTKKSSMFKLDLDGDEDDDDVIKF